LELELELGLENDRQLFDTALEVDESSSERSCKNAPELNSPLDCPRN